MKTKHFLFLADELLADVAQGVYECTRYGAAGSVKSEKEGNSIRV
ncbi:MAG TPA: hypothetical protein VMN57_03575 [Anaerolineales bacterium]|nr:hypothetical protein [Anaerolineales bacterium]